MSSIYVLTPITELCKEWLEENVFCDFRFGLGFPIEWRYIDDIIGALTDVGFVYEEDFEVHQ